MKNINELIEERTAKLKAAKNIVSKSEKEDRKMSDTDNEEYQTLIDDVDAIAKQIEQKQKMEELEKKNLTPIEKPNEETDDKKRYAEAFDKMIRSTKDLSTLTEEEKAILNRAQTITTTGGGYLIAEEFGNKIIESLLAFGGMREVSTIIKTSTGADLSFPTNDDTSNKGAILAINTQIGEEDLVFGQKVLGEFMYTSKLVRVPWQLLQDSAFDFPAYLSKQLSIRLGRIHNDHFTTGDGSNKPNGVVAGAASSGVTAAVAAISRTNIINLIHSVDPEYRKNGRLMFNDSTLKVLRLLVDNESRPLYQPNFATGVFDTIEGEPYTINQSMADIGSDAKPMLYGDFKEYYIRDIMPLRMTVMLERYADYLQNGYFAFMRSDGLLMNTAAVKYLVNATT